MKKTITFIILALITITISCKKDNSEALGPGHIPVHSKSEYIIDNELIKQGYKFVPEYSTSSFMSYEKDDTYLFVHPQKTKKTSSVKSDFSITYKFTANANILSGTMNAEAPNIFDDGGGLINELLFNTSSIDFNANQVVSVHVSGGAIYIQGNQSPTSLWCYPRDKFLIITIKYQDNPSTNLTYNLINAAINADPTGSFVIN